MEEVEVDVGRLQAIGAERLLHDLLESPHRLREHRPAVHPGPGATVVDLLLGHQGIRRVPIDLREELADDGRVGVEVMGDESAPRARIHRLEDDRPRPVREEHRHVAPTVRVLHHRGEHLGAHDEDSLVHPHSDVGVGGGEGVHEPRAPLLEVEDGGAREPEPLGHDAARVGVGVLGDRGGVDDEIDVIDLEPRVLQGHLRGLVAEVGGGHGRIELAVEAVVVDLADAGVLVRGFRQPLKELVGAGGDSPLLDPRPLGDPLVRGGEAARQEVVVHHTLGHGHPRSDDLGFFHGGLLGRGVSTTRPDYNPVEGVSSIGNAFVDAMLGQCRAGRTHTSPNRGSRFSEKALSPSRWSAVSIMSPWASASQARQVSRSR